MEQKTKIALRKSLVLLLAVIVTSCSSNTEVDIPKEIQQLDSLTVMSPDAEPARTVAFQKEAVFGSTDSVILGNLTDAAVDDNGRVFIADRNQNMIHAYRPNGRYLAQLGSEGKGPGEFTGIAAIKQQGQYLYAQDVRQRRINVYRLDSLTFSHSVPLSQQNRDIEQLSGANPAGFYIRNDERLLIRFSESFSAQSENTKRTIRYYLMDHEGNIVSDKIFEQQGDAFVMDRTGGSIMFMAPPYGRSSIFAMGPEHKIYTSWTEDFLIKIHNRDGDYQKAIYYPYQNSKLNIDEVVNEYDNNRQRNMLRNADHPATWPAINSLSVDDKERLWISTIVDNKEIYKWWLINSDGDLLATFTWPRNRSLMVAKDGAVYTKETNEETGVEQLVRYNITF
jgi:hypothetical protein